MPELQERRRKDDLSKKDIAEVLRRLEGLESQIGDCSKRINVRIDERMRESSAIRNMQEKVEAVTLGFEELKGIVKGAIGNGDRRLRDHDIEIEQLSLRITGVENAVEEIKGQITQLQHNMATISLDLKHVSLQTQDLPKRLNNIESMLGTLIEKAVNGKSMPSKQSGLSAALTSVPNKAWLIIGFGALIGLAYIVTGDASLLVKLGIGG